jgi:hypothetical protein
MLVLWILEVDDPAGNVVLATTIKAHHRLLLLGLWRSFSSLGPS